MSAVKVSTNKEGDVALKTSATYGTAAPVSAIQKIKVTQDLNIKSITHNRANTYDGAYVPTGVVINNPISTIEMGDEWVLLAHVLPAFLFEDNLVSFKSSNPDVCSVTFGVLKANSLGTATITATAVGTNFTDSFTVSVKAKQHVSYTDEQIYKPKAPNADDTTTVTNWLLDGIKYASANGYKKMLLPDGAATYNISPEAVLGNDTTKGDSINRVCCYFPSNLCLDLNGCTLAIQKSVWSTFTISGSTVQGGYMLFVFGSRGTPAGTGYRCVNSSIVNGKIMGEVYQLETKTSGTEGIVYVHLANCENCGLENVEMCNCPGFNIATQCTWVTSDNVGLGCTMMGDFLEAGGINDDGTDRDEAMTWRTKTTGYGKGTNNGISVAQWDLSMSPYYMFGSVWGYAGDFCKATLYDIVWFDKDNKVIQTARNQCVYYPYRLPDGADHFRFAAHVKDQPKGGGIEGVYWGCIFHVSFAYKCYIRNCYIHDNCSTGIAWCGGAHNVVEGCTFYNNGFRDPSSHIDFEDNGDTTAGGILRNCTFKTGIYGCLIFVIARNVAVHDNIINCKTYGGRVYGLRFWGNWFGGQSMSLGYAGDCIFAYNATNSGFYKPEKRNSLSSKTPGYYNFYEFDNIKYQPSLGTATPYSPSSAVSLSKTP